MDQPDPDNRANARIAKGLRSLRAIGEVRAAGRDRASVIRILAGRIRSNEGETPRRRPCAGVSVRRGDWRLKKRAHRVNVRIDEDLYRELRREAEKSGLSLSAVMRLSLAVGWSWCE